MRGHGVDDLNIRIGGGGILRSTAAVLHDLSGATYLRSRVGREERTSLDDDVATTMHCHRATCLGYGHRHSLETTLRQPFATSDHSVLALRHSLYAAKTPMAFRLVAVATQTNAHANTAAQIPAERMYALEGVEIGGARFVKPPLALCTLHVARRLNSATRIAGAQKHLLGHILEGASVAVD